MDSKPALTEPRKQSVVRQDGLRSTPNSSAAVCKSEAVEEDTYDDDTRSSLKKLSLRPAPVSSRPHTGGRSNDFSETPKETAGSGRTSFSRPASREATGVSPRPSSSSFLSKGGPGRPASSHTGSYPFVH